MQRYEEAIACFDHALALDPDFVFALANKGYALNELGKFGEAIVCFDTILKDSPNNLRVMTAKGIALRGQGDNTGALRYFDAVLEAHPNDKEPGGNLMQTNRNYSNRSAMAISECYEEMGQFRPALRYAWLAKTKYRYYSWCGTCISSANFAMNKRIAYLALRLSRVQIWAGFAVFGFVVLRWKKRSGRNATIAL